MAQFHPLWHKPLQPEQPTYHSDDDHITQALPLADMPTHTGMPDAPANWNAAYAKIGHIATDPAPDHGVYNQIPYGEGDEGATQGLPTVIQTDPR